MGKLDVHISHGGGGPDLGVLGPVLIVVILIGSGAASAIASALVTVLIIAGCAVAGLAVLGGTGWLVHRARQDRRGRPIAARVISRLPPKPAPRLEESSKPALGPAREVHIHLHGLTPGQIAAIITRSNAYLEGEDQ